MQYSHWYLAVLHSYSGTVENMFTFRVIKKKKKFFCVVNLRCKKKIWVGNLGVLGSKNKQWGYKKKKKRKKLTPKAVKQAVPFNPSCHERTLYLKPQASI